MPWRATLAADIVESVNPWSWTRPLVGRVIPETQLRSVLLPAPFGPISPTMEPASSAKLTPLKAWMPPKFTETFSMASVISGPPPEAAHHSPETLGHEHHDDDQQQTE